MVTVVIGAIICWRTVKFNDILYTHFVTGVRGFVFIEWGCKFARESWQQLILENMCCQRIHEFLSKQFYFSSLHFFLLDREMAVSKTSTAGALGWKKEREKKWWINGNSVKLEEDLATHVMIASRVIVGEVCTCVTRIHAKKDNWKICWEWEYVITTRVRYGCHTYASCNTWTVPRTSIVTPTFWIFQRVRTLQETRHKNVA